MISVIIPTFNRANLLARAIQSSLRQAVSELEVLVVDDGSTDNTEMIVSQLRQKDLRLIYVKQYRNLGCASARNLGVQHAKGDTIAFLDSDDEYRGESLSELYRTLVLSKADFVYSPSIEVSRYFGISMVNYPAARGSPGRFWKEHLFTNNARPGAILYTRQIILKVGGFDETMLFNEDSDFLQRVALEGVAAYSPIPSVIVHHHGSQKSANQIEVRKAALYSFEKVVNRYAMSDEIAARLEEHRSELVKSILAALVAEGRTLEAEELLKHYGNSKWLQHRLVLILRFIFLYKIHATLRRVLRIIIGLSTYRVC